MNFIDKVNNVSVKEGCGKCDARLLNISFLEREKKPDVLCCVLCDDQGIALLEQKVKKTFSRGRGGRGRGHSSKRGGKKPNK